jgi:dihydroxynaphthoic acid synthetase
MTFDDIIYAKDNGVAKITINRPQAFNAFRTSTLKEIVGALEDAELDRDIRVIVLRGAGDKAFCTGGDTQESKDGGYDPQMDYWHGRVHHMIRDVTKPVIAAVNGYAIGGGHILHVICDISIASETAKFGQAGPKVGSFDAGFGAAYLARVVGEKKAREIWFFCRIYSAQEALAMGLVNKVVAPAELDREVQSWCDEIKALAPYAIRFLKHAFNADTDHISGFENMSMAAVRQYWETEEAKGQKAQFKERQKQKKSAGK